MKGAVKMRGFKVPNNIFKTGLKHSQLVVYLYLLSRQKNNLVTATYAQIADKLDMAPKTVYNAISGLADKSLVSKSYKSRNGQIVAIQLKLASFPQQSWVWVETRLFDLKLTASELNVYLYIKCRANECGCAFPSITLIHQHTGLAKGTVHKAICSLIAHSLLRKKHYVKKDRSFGNNNYTVINCADHETIMDSLRKKKARTRKLRRGLVRKTSFRLPERHSFSRKIPALRI